MLRAGGGWRAMEWDPGISAKTFYVEEYSFPDMGFSLTIILLLILPGFSTAIMCDQIGHDESGTGSQLENRDG